MHLTEQHALKIATDFKEEDVEKVVSALARLSTSDTWDSECNLNNAIGAILDLSKSDVSEVRRLVDAAKSDFRDVIYWWMLESKKAEHPE